VFKTSNIVTSPYSPFLRGDRLVLIIKILPSLKINELIKLIYTLLIHYSYLKTLTGLLVAAFIAWNPIVDMAIKRTRNPAIIKLLHPRLII